MFRTPFRNSLFVHSALWAFVLLLAGAAANCLAQDADQRFDSRNQARQVRADAIENPPPWELRRWTNVREVQRLEPVDARDIREIGRRLGQDTYVAGYVHSIDVLPGGSPVILQLGEDRRTAFQVVMFSGDMERWGATVDDISRAFQRQTIVVGGPVGTHRDRVQIIVTLPSQLHIVRQ